MLPFLGGLDAAANCNASNPVMAGLKLETGLDALIALGARELSGGRHAAAIFLLWRLVDDDDLRLPRTFDCNRSG
jgi:hypothetical protein